MTELSLQLFGEIGYGQTLQQIASKLQTTAKFDAIRVQINSPGGSVTEGRAIKQLLLAQNKTLITECFGECSSIATEIFLAGKERIAHEGVRFLVHRPYGWIEGTSTDMASVASDLEAIEKEMIALYQARDKKKRSYEEWRAMLAKTTVFGARELLDMGFATQIKASFQLKYKTKMVKNTLQAFRKLFKSYKALDVTLADGQILEVLTENETPQVGDAVVVKSTGEVPPAGVHILQDGTLIQTDEEGIIIAIDVPSQAGNYEDRIAALEKANAELVSKIEALVAILEGKFNTAQAKYKNDGKTQSSKMDLASLRNKIIENQRKLYK